VLRDVRLPPELDDKPITDRWNGVLPDISRLEHQTILKELGISKKSIDWKRYHISTKKGPSGQALWTSVSELLNALPELLISDLTLIAGSPLRSHMDAIRNAQFDGLSIGDVWLNLYPHNSKAFRKLSYFSDKEGKSRVIAILDYWSQTALKPLHDSINRILKSIKTDCTFNQNHFQTTLPVGTDVTYHSLDLSNATDRMPLNLQKKIIGSIIGRRKSDAWGRVLVDWVYPCKERPDGIKYQTGQPMGAYSSWPAMALTHHYIVKLAALKVNKQNFWDYSLLGDDIVIADTSVAESYRAILKTLDMPISDAKTHVSKDIYEFAKRWVYFGIEVTPFSIGGLLKSWRKYPYLHNFLETQDAHGWALPEHRLPELIRSIYSTLGKHQQGARTLKLYLLFDALYGMKKTGTFNTKAFEVLVQYFGLPSTTPDISIETTEKVIREIRLEMLQADMGHLQVDVEKFLHERNKLVKSRYPDLDAQSHFWESNRSHMPLIMAVNDKIDDSMDTLCMMFDPDTPVDKLLEVEGISKYSITSGTFYNLRDSRAILLAFSRIVKVFITKVFLEMKPDTTATHHSA
jgi:hypothetical protein